MDIHFTEAVAQETSLAAGTYTWTSTTFFGPDDNFSVRNFVVGGYAKYPTDGTAVVTVDGEEHHIELTINVDGDTYMIQFDGKLNDAGTEGGEDTEAVVFTKMEYKTYNTTYWFYEYRLSNESGDSMKLFVNDVQAKENFIYTDDSYEWISISYAGNLGYFSTQSVIVDGAQVSVSKGNMVVVTDEETYHMDITITLNDTNVFKFSGKIGEESGGGTTPSEPTKLATPSVSGLVDGNAATVSWQEIAGAKDYTVTLNGTDVKTVTETYIVYTDLAYETTYSVSVVANPADATVNAASDAGTATFTTGAEGTEGGDEGGNEGGADENYEDWTFNASLDMGSVVLTLTDGNRTLTFKLSELAGATFIINGTGVLNATNVTVDGVAAESASGSVELSSSLNYHVVINAVINGVTYTGTSTNAII